MQTKKRAKAVKFGKKTDKPINNDKEAIKPEPVTKHEQKEEETPPEQIESKPIEPKPEEQQPTREEESEITETQQTEIKEVIIETQQEQPQQEPPKEPPQDAPMEAADPLPEEPTAETQETTLKIEVSDTNIVETKVKKNFLGYFMLISIISFVIGLLSMAGINMLNQKNQNSHNPQNTTNMSVTKKISPTNKPSPTPEPLNLAQYNIKILNGSGITGAAAKLKTSLTDEGFTVATTGNAPDNNYTNTTISAKKDANPKYLERLKTFLSKSYALASNPSTPISSNEQADIIITIGVK